MVDLNACRIRIGFDDSVAPVKQYHWAIDLNKGNEYKVVDFWGEQIWTTEQYRQKHRNRMCPGVTKSFGNRD